MKIFQRLKFDKYYYPVFIIVVVIVFVIVNSLFNTVELSPQKGMTTIYYVDHISQAHQLLIDKFNERYAGQIHVEAINLPFNKFSTNERKELLARYLKSKSDRIDIFAVDQIWVPRFAKWGVSLDKYFPKEESGKFLGKAMESCYYQGSLAALPLYLDISVTFARKDLILKQKGGEAWLKELKGRITWERFLQLNQQMHSPESFFSFQAQDYEGLMCFYDELVASQNASIIKNDSIYLVGNPAAKRSLQFLVDLVNKYHASPMDVTDFKENDSFRYFLSNNGAFVRSWPSVFSNDDRVFPGFGKLKKDIVQIPSPYFSGQKKVAVFGGWNLMISRNSQKINEVLKFLKFVTSPEAQKIMFENGLYLPISEQIYSDSLYTTAHPELKFFRDYIQEGVHRPFLKEYTGISDVLTYYIKAAIKKEMSVDSALVRATRKINSTHILLK
jgi:multiple sugar transport system substrate-binding protein